MTSNLVSVTSRETAEQILFGGASLWGFTDLDFEKAEAAAAEHRKESVAADD